ncbi:MAG: hypothetical protein Q9227_007215 [Pyrenula ochraceoflavens]
MSEHSMCCSPSNLMLGKCNAGQPSLQGEPQSDMAKNAGGSTEPTDSTAICHAVSPEVSRHQRLLDNTVNLQEPTESPGSPEDCGIDITKLGRPKISTRPRLLSQTKDDLPTNDLSNDPPAHFIQPNKDTFSPSIIFPNELESAPPSTIHSRPPEEGEFLNNANAADRPCSDIDALQKPGYSGPHLKPPPNPFQWSEQRPSRYKNDLGVVSQQNQNDPRSPSSWHLQALDDDFLMRSCQFGTTVYTQPNPPSPASPSFVSNPAMGSFVAPPNHNKQNSPRPRPEHYCRHRRRRCPSPTCQRNFGGSKLHVVPPAGERALKYLRKPIHIPQTAESFPDYDPALRIEPLPNHQIGFQLNPPTQTQPFQPPLPSPAASSTASIKPEMRQEGFEPYKTNPDSSIPKNKGWPCRYPWEHDKDGKKTVWFKDASNRRKHEQSHWASTPYGCYYRDCNTKIARSDDAKRHLVEGGCKVHRKKFPNPEKGNNGKPKFPLPPDFDEHRRRDFEAAKLIEEKVYAERKETWLAEGKKMPVPSHQVKTGAG